MDRGVHHEEVVQVGGGECRRLGMTGGVVCSYCLAASKTKPEARREGEESIHVADKGYLEGERSSGIEAMGRRFNLQINVQTGILEHCDVNT